MKKLQKFVSLSAALAVIVSMTACAQNTSAGQTTEATTTAKTVDTAAATLKEDDKAVIEEIDIGETEKLENGNVRWLASWDINPTEGKAMPVELEMFQTQYGGSIEHIPVVFEERYTVLSKMVLADDSPDMFSGGDLDVFPKAAISNLIQPLDDYVDFSADYWAEMAPTNENFTYKGKHYVAATSSDAGVVMIYNKRTIEDNALEDPAELLAAGNWNWNTLSDMMFKFCNRAESKFAVDGWWFESALSMTTGVPYIGFENNQLVNNLSNPLIGKAQEYMQNMNKNDLPFPKAENNWTVAPENIGAGKTLFYPCGIWALYNVDISAYGDQGDIMFVPMPKCPDADNYYLPTSLTAYVLCAGSKNPEAVGAFVKCARIAQSDERVAEIAKTQYIEEYGWTEEMYDMLITTREMTNENPVIEFYGAVTQDLHDLVNNPMKESFNAGASWAQTRESITYSIDAELEKANSKLG